jgi:hypothetical protein
MLTIEPTGAVLGATLRGIDLARPLREPTGRGWRPVWRACGRGMCWWSGVWIG